MNIAEEGAKSNERAAALRAGGCDWVAGGAGQTDQQTETNRQTRQEAAAKRRSTIVCVSAAKMKGYKCKANDRQATVLAQSLPPSLSLFLSCSLALLTLNGSAKIENNFELWRRRLTYCLLICRQISCSCKPQCHMWQALCALCVGVAYK